MTARHLTRVRRLLQGLLVLVPISAALTACSGSSDPDPPATPQAAGTDASETSSGLSAQRMAQWTRNCALCHIRGEGGAPVLGDLAAWQPRWEQGEAVLLAHTVEGMNNMPPLGYCMDCEEADFLALIRFMGGER